MQNKFSEILAINFEQLPSLFFELPNKISIFRSSQDQPT